ncbi:MAG TPA: glycoside hydrolase TIM-barrel-like domain-containing protein [Methylocella sp.]|nr:glycoside hydrolase TIM-barrel-like domain-containing protein [Methylocella sp.]
MTLYINGVNLLPSTGEFTYDTISYQGRRIAEPAMLGINTYYSGGPPGSTLTDLKESIAQLQAAFPVPPATNACTTVAIVCAWFASASAGTDQAAETAATCRIYPATTYIDGDFQKWNGSGWSADNWQCSSLTQSSAGLIPIWQNAAGSFNYGGTPSDQSLYRCIQYLKGLGLRVVFYPFILVDSPGKPWRGQITYDPTFTNPDVSSATMAAIRSFLGTAVRSQFTQVPANLTVSYSGSPTDFTYRRMILHYANLCAMAGGVDLFLIGSELRGLETVRGPAWTAAGSGSPPSWDYPFLYDSSYGLLELSDEVRAIFDAAGLTKDTTGLHNLVSYAADWSSWMGWQHNGSNPPPPYTGQWPHLDQLWSHTNIDLVCFDNYLPLSDWTTGSGGLDVLNWAQPAPSSWPPSSGALSGLGLSGTPTIYSKPYLKANIEGGEKFNWYYADSNNLGRGRDPNGTDLQVSVPEGDRLTQTRHPFYPQQEILGNKQLRWWWNNQHYALYDTGSGEVPQGSATGWVPQSKSIVFTEYGFPSNDKCTNQPNVFFSAGSVESGTAFWSIWEPADGGPDAFLPKPDQNLQLLALEAFYEYWFVDGNNAAAGGVEMIQPAFCSVWNWDARPFPVFPNLFQIWGDVSNWQAGNWLNGKGPFIALPVADPPPGVPVPVGNFPSLPGLTWSVHKRPSFSTRVTSHTSGREVRVPLYAVTLYEFELTIEGLDSEGAFPGLGVKSMQSLWDLYVLCQGQFNTFLYTDPADNALTGAVLGTGNGTQTVFTFQRPIVSTYEPVSWVTAVNHVYLNGVNQTSGWAWATPNTLTFATAPGSGVLVLADFDYAFNCRFLDDQEDFEEFMNGLWRVQSLKFRSVKP